MAHPRQRNLIAVPVLRKEAAFGPASVKKDHAVPEQQLQHATSEDEADGLVAVSAPRSSETYRVHVVRDHDMLRAREHGPSAVKQPLYARKVDCSEFHEFNVERDESAKVRSRQRLRSSCAVGLKVVGPSIPAPSVQSEKDVQPGVPAAKGVAQASAVQCATRSRAEELECPHRPFSPTR